MMRRRTVLLALPALITQARAQDGLPIVRIGVLWDRSGLGSVTSGVDQIVAARLAVDDFGHLSRGYPVELVDAEFDRRPDQAVAIARRWFDRDQVAAIVDVPGVAAAAQVQELARLRDRTVMNTGSFNAALTGAACSPTASHWLEDTRAITAAMSIGLAAEGVKTWFLVVPDDVTGVALQTGATAAIEAVGGRLLGFTRHPAEATSFIQALANARASGAEAIGLCAYGSTLTAQIREARATGLFDGNRSVCGYAAMIKDIHALGAAEAADLRIVTGFYWNQNERTRSFAKRFNILTGRMPDKPHAATYAAIGHFLRTVETTDTIDGVALNIGLRQEQPYFFGANGQLRFDGRLLLNLGLYRVKRQSEVAADWDYYKQTATIPARDAFRPALSGFCALTR